MVVVLGHYGNRIPPDQSIAAYPIAVERVAGRSQLTLVRQTYQLVDATGFDRGEPEPPQDP